jgi:hypothetical protein
MIQVTVQRAPADTPGPDITDALLASEPAARERGRVEIDKNNTNRVLVTASGPYRQWLAPGSLLAYHGRRGSYRALVRRCALTITRDGDRFSATRSIELEREP